MNFWAFTPRIFDEIEQQFMEFYPLNKDNLKSEFYIPKVVDQVIKRGIAQVKVLKTDAKWFGVTYKEDTPGVNAAPQALTRKGNIPTWGAYILFPAVWGCAVYFRRAPLFVLSLFP